MKRAQKIFEAHVYTVSAHSDPMVQAIQSDLFPIIENYLAQKDMITESTDTLSWEQIIGVFKAAEKLTGGGVLQRASKATSSFKNAVQGKVSEILSKYQSNAPVENADVKVDKLSNKAMQASIYSTAYIVSIRFSSSSAHLFNSKSIPDLLNNSIPQFK